MQPQKEIILFIVATTFLLFILLSFIVTILFLNKQQQHGFVKELELVKAGFEKDLLQAQMDVQEQTFQHISLELHDNVSHFLSLAKLQLTTLKKPMPDELLEKMDTTTQLITNSLDEIRNISKSLNTENIKSIGLVKTVQQQIEQIKKLGQFTINFTLSGKICYLDDQKEIILFRIVQESLNNIVRHSKASLIQVQLHYEVEKLVLSIHDNGIGFNVENLHQKENCHSVGLKNIIKRSSLLNATHKITSTPGKGTTIIIITPF